MAPSRPPCVNHISLLICVLTPDDQLFRTNHLSSALQTCHFGLRGPIRSSRCSRRRYAATPVTSRPALGCTPAFGILAADVVLQRALGRTRKTLDAAASCTLPHPHLRPRLWLKAPRELAVALAHRRRSLADIRLQGYRHERATLKLIARYRERHGVMIEPRHGPTALDLAESVDAIDYGRLCRPMSSATRHRRELNS